MPESPIFEIVILVIFVGTVGGVIWYSMKHRQQQNQANAYLEALEYMAEGNDRLAIQKFKDAVRDNSDNISAYIQLGDLLRKRGMTGNAIRVHQDLTLRGSLMPNQQIRILKSLLKDYAAVQDFDKGISTARKILDNDRNPEPWVIDQLLAMYEKSRQWSDAVALVDRFQKVVPSETQRRSALYRVFMGLAQQREGKTKEARVRFKEALKKDPACAAAFYYLGKSYREEARLDDAVKAWTQLCNDAPREAYIAFPELEKAWFEMGRFGDAENLYEELLGREQQGLQAGLALAEIYNKKGDFDTAMDVLAKLEESYPESPLLTEKKISVYFNKGQYKQAASQSLSYLNATDTHSNGRLNYSCRNCGNLSKTPEWICPNCNELETYIT